MLMPRRTVTEKNPVSIMETEMFADLIREGDMIPAVIRKWDYSVSTNPTAYEVPARVKVLKKYPYLVETDRGVFPWKDIVIGYYRYRGPGIVSDDLQSDESVFVKKAS